MKEPDTVYHALPQGFPPFGKEAEKDENNSLST